MWEFNIHILLNLSNGRYTYTGYIDGATDRCIIQEVRSDGYVRVKYPISRGRYRTAYESSNAFFVNTNFSTQKMQLGTSKTAYRRSNLSQSLGTVYANDQVIVVGYSNNNTQVIYPVSVDTKWDGYQENTAYKIPQEVQILKMDIIPLRQYIVERISM